MKKHMLMSVAGVLALGGVSQASMLTGAVYTVPHAGLVEVIFKSSDAGATGMLYHLGSENGGGITYAPSSDARNLGSAIFSNKGTAAGQTVSLGLFDAGDIVHFAYIITKGSGNAPTGETFRTDIVADRNYYGQQALPSVGGASVTLIGIEDIRNPSKSDWDYNDMMFHVSVTPAVPSPGPVALAGAGLMLAASRRKKISL